MPLLFLGVEYAYEKINRTINRTINSVGLASSEQPVCHYYDIYV